MLDEQPGIFVDGTDGKRSDQTLGDETRHFDDIVGSKPLDSAAVDDIHRDDAIAFSGERQHNVYGYGGVSFSPADRECRPVLAGKICLLAGVEIRLLGGCRIVRRSQVGIQTGIESLHFLAPCRARPFQLLERFCPVCVIPDVAVG